MPSSPINSIEERGILADLAGAGHHASLRELWQPMQTRQTEDRYADLLSKWDKLWSELKQVAAEYDVPEAVIEEIAQLLLTALMSEHTENAIEKVIKKHTATFTHYTKGLGGYRFE